MKEEGGGMGRLSKVKWCLVGCLVVVVVLMVGSVFMPNLLAGMVQSVADSDFAGRLRGTTLQDVYQENAITEMVVDTIGVSKIDFQPVVILKEEHGELYLPIWIGQPEANAISVVLEGIDVPRPLTSDLVCTIVDRIGAKVEYVVISDIQDNTFYAKIALLTNWIPTEIDARPSNAIAIALRANAPVYTTKAVLEKAGVTLEQEKN
jgi:bifunctional DNase/RNase